MSMKNSNDTIGNRKRDLPTCSAVPQPNVLPRAPHKTNGKGNVVPGGATGAYRGEKITVLLSWKSWN